MITSAAQITGPEPAKPAATQTASGASGLSFHDILSAMNPLQYIPVVGTLYRAITGDVIPEAVRAGGSMLVSGLLGGPIGLVTNIAMTIAEKVTGVDPEKIAAAQFHAEPSETVASAEMPTAAPASIDSPPVALSPKQLAEYGVRSDASGTLKLGDVEGADVLNGLELVRLGKAAAAYAVNQAMPLAGAVRAG
jgi:hypothetical protein